MPKRVVDVQTGEIHVAGIDTALQTNGIGSCVAVALYDPCIPLGGMAHVMLPGQAPLDAECPRRYTVNALCALVNEMQRRGTPRGCLQACCAGGGNVLRSSDDTICNSNVDSVLACLAALEIPVAARSLGGFERRVMRLEVGSGKLFLSVGERPRSLLWQSTGCRRYVVSAVTGTEKFNCPAIPPPSRKSFILSHGS